MGSQYVMMAFETLDRHVLRSIHPMCRRLNILFTHLRLAFRLMSGIQARDPALRVDRARAIPGTLIASAAV
jgi:hypothetical protein